MDPRIQIHPKMSWIRNTGFRVTRYKQINFREDGQGRYPKKENKRSRITGNGMKIVVKSKTKDNEKKQLEE
jgi:hypothetical protein